MMTDIESAIRWYESEIRYLEAAPSINGCSATEEWREQARHHKLALRALRDLKYLQDNEKEEPM